jgi:hypothetical protein
MILPLNHRHCTVDTFPTMIEVDASMQGTVEQQMFYNRKTLREITELRYSDVKTKVSSISLHSSKDQCLIKKNMLLHLSIKTCHEFIQNYKYYIDT